MERDTEEGFTLIELLVVIIIIGILSAIAIPVFLRQREKAHQVQAIQDMKNAALSVESWAIDNNGSYAALHGATQNSPELANEGFRRSLWVSLRVTATPTAYCVQGENVNLPARQFVYRSGTGKVGEVGVDGETAC
jgi:type IV pilus assembly protein PilA